VTSEISLAKAKKSSTAETRCGQDRKILIALKLLQCKNFPLFSCRWFFRHKTQKELDMKVWVCSVCGYVHIGEEAPEVCPQCKAPRSKFKEEPASENKIKWADEHKIGVAQGLDKDVVQGLRENFAAECTEVGMYLAMSRQADREGFPEVAETYKRVALEESEHASKFAELLGEVVYPDTKKNLELRVVAEAAANEGKLALAKRAKELNYDAIHDTVHEMCKDEARHGAAFSGLLKRYFEK